MKKALILLVAAGLASGSVHAQSAGDNVLQVGWLHLQTLDKGEPMHTHLTPSPGLNVLGVITDFRSPGTDSSVDNANTLLLANVHYFTDHFAVKAEGGLPPIFHINGTGTVQPQSTIPLIQNSGLLPKINLGDPNFNPLAAARQWSPAIIAQLAFFSPTARFRPYVGVGVSYIWFTDLSPDPEFVNALNTKFGTTLALAAGKLGQGPTHVGVSASYQWSPVYNAGLSYAISKHWGVVSSVSYLPLEASAHITIFAHDGTQLSDSSAKLKVNTLISALLLTYRF
jgi:outer membrane protein